MTKDLLEKIYKVEKAIQTCKDPSSTCTDCPYKEPYEDCRGNLLPDAPCMDDFTNDVIDVFLPLLSEYRKLQDICNITKVNIDVEVEERTEFLCSVFQSYTKELNQKLAKAESDRDEYVKNIEKMRIIYERAVKESVKTDECWGCPCTKGRTSIKCPLEDDGYGSDECVKNLVLAATELIEKEKSNKTSR